MNNTCCFTVRGRGGASCETITCHHYSILVDVPEPAIYVSTWNVDTESYDLMTISLADVMGIYPQPGPKQA